MAEYKITALPALLAASAVDTDVIAIVNVSGDITNKMEVSELRTLMVTTTAVTSAGALMDSELTSIADVKALNQSVISGAAPVFDATNFTNLPSTSPAGSDTEIQFNNAGSFGGADVYWTGTKLGINQGTPLAPLHAKTDGTTGSTGDLIAVLEGSLPELWFKDTFGGGSGMSIVKYNNTAYIVKTNAAGAYAGYATNIDLGEGRWYFGGGTAPTAVVDCKGSSTSYASLRIRDGVAPTSPYDGDVWQDGTNLKIQINGVTKTVTLT